MNRAALSLAAALLVVSASMTACTSRQDDGPRNPAETSQLYRGPYRAPAGAVLSTPVDDELDYRALRVLLANIDHTPPGATIRIVAFSLTLHPVADALIAAHDRGVRVQVVADGRTNDDDDAPPRLVEALGSDRRAPSFAVLTRGSARGGFSHLHQKTWMFSRTGRSRWVTVLGSMNLSYYSTGQYNDMYSFVGRRDVYDAFGRVFADQARDRPVADPAVSVRLGADRAAFFPGFTIATDPTLRLLRRLPAAGTRVRMVAAYWSGERGLDIAALLADRVAGGARVEVVRGASMGTQVEAALAAAGVVVHEGVFDDGSDVHNKLLLASYVGPDGRRHRVISTGSNNFGDGAADRDDVVVDVDADRGTARAAWDDYQRYVDRLVRRTASEEP